MWHSFIQPQEYFLVYCVFSTVMLEPGGNDYTLDSLIINCQFMFCQNLKRLINIINHRRKSVFWQKVKTICTAVFIGQKKNVKQLSLMRQPKHSHFSPDFCTDNCLFAGAWDINFIHNISLNFNCHFGGVGAGEGNPPTPLPKIRERELGDSSRQGGHFGASRTPSRIAWMWMFHATCRLSVITPLWSLPTRLAPIPDRGSHTSGSRHFLVGYAEPCPQKREGTKAYPGTHGGGVPIP